MPDQAANQLTAEMMVHGEDVDSSVEKYESYYDNYKEKGFNEHAAQAMAVEALEGREEPPGESLRFARLRPESSQSFTVPDGTSGEEIAQIAETLSGKPQDSVHMNGQQIY